MTHDIKHYHLTRGAAAEVRFNNRGAEGHTWSLWVLALLESLMLAWGEQLKV